MYQLNNKLTNVIFVSPQGLTSGGNAGFPNTNSQDEEMTRAINAVIEAKYCIDKARYFATGFSYGGSMSYTAACNIGDVFRAIGAMSGAPISGATCTSKKPARPVAVWATHGDADTALPITLAQPIIDSFVKNNGCMTTRKAGRPSPLCRVRRLHDRLSGGVVREAGSIPTPFQASPRRPSPTSSNSSDHDSSSPWPRWTNDDVVTSAAASQQTRSMTASAIRAR